MPRFLDVVVVNLTAVAFLFAPSYDKHTDVVPLLFLRTVFLHEPNISLIASQ